MLFLRPMYRTEQLRIRIRISYKVLLVAAETGVLEDDELDLVLSPEDLALLDSVKTPSPSPGASQGRAGRGRGRGGQGRDRGKAAAGSEGAQKRQR